MANIKSQIKRNKQAEVARERNKAIKTALKTEVKKFNASLVIGVDEAAVNLKAVTVALDKAASDKVIHKNEASRKKAVAAKKFNLLKANPPAPAAEEEKKPKPSKTAKTTKTVAKTPAAKKPLLRKTAAAEK